MGSPPVLDRDRYGESGGPLDDEIRPVFVTVTTRRVRESVGLAVEARSIARTVATLTGRPEENVHIIYAPDAAGRVAFGGTLIE